MVYLPPPHVHLPISSMLALLLMSYPTCSFHFLCVLFQCLVQHLFSLSILAHLVGWDAVTLLEGCCERGKGGKEEGGREGGKDKEDVCKRSSYNPLHYSQYITHLARHSDALKLFYPRHHETSCKHSPFANTFPSIAFCPHRYSQEIQGLYSNYSLSIW